MAIRRLYHFKGEILTLQALLNKLEEILTTDGNNEQWGNLGVSIEDYDEDSYCVYTQDPENHDLQIFDTKEDAMKVFEEEKQYVRDVLNNGSYTLNMDDDREFSIICNHAPYDEYMVILERLGDLDYE